MKGTSADVTWTLAGAPGGGVLRWVRFVGASTEVWRDGETAYVTRARGAAALREMRRQARLYPTRYRLTKRED